MQRIEIDENTYGWSAHYVEPLVFLGPSKHGDHRPTLRGKLTSVRQFPEGSYTETPLDSLPWENVTEFTLGPIADRYIHFNPETLGRERFGKPLSDAEFCTGLPRYTVGLTSGISCNGELLPLPTVIEGAVVVFDASQKPVYLLGWEHPDGACILSIDEKGAWTRVA